MTPYLVGIMDAFNDYGIEEIVFCKPTQVGGTEALQNMLGYVVSEDPAPTMIVYPTEVLAKSISENRLQPMLRLSPATKDKFHDLESSLLELQFDGMYLSLAGSNSPSGLASKACRYLFLDEVDKYPGSTKREADPIKLARERTKTFSHNRKIFVTSTPTLREGHIWTALQGVDVERHYFVPCPHCGEYIELKWSQVRFPDEEGMSYQDRAELATYACQVCGCIINDADIDSYSKASLIKTLNLVDYVTYIARFKFIFNINVLEIAENINCIFASKCCFFFNNSVDFRKHLLCKFKYFTFILDSFFCIIDVVFI